MKKLILLLTLFAATCWAGLPPTTSELSTDSSNITTFFYQFPNFTGTHTGVTMSLGVNGVAGGGTGASSFSANQLIIGGTTSTSAFQVVPGATTGYVLTSTGATSAPSWQLAGSGNAITQLTGDVSAIGPGSTTATLATVNSNTGSFGSSTAIPNFTVNGKGLVTAAGSSVVIAPAGTLTGTTLASNVTASSLTSVGTISSGTWNGSVIGPVYGGSGLNSNVAYELFAGGTVANGNFQQISGVGTSGQVLTSNGAGALPTWQASGSGSAITQLTGDVTAIGPGSTTATLATVNSNTGSWGSQSMIPTFTVNGKGLMTAAGNTTITAPAGSLTGSTLASNVTGSSLTSVGTIASGTWNGSVIGPVYGGSGLSSTVAYELITGGTVANGNFQQISAGSSVGQVLTYQGTSSLPTWTSAVPTAPRCQYTIDSGNGAGSTNTKVRRWSNTRVNTGSCLTYTDSATAGGSWTVNVQGLYTIDYNDGDTAAGGTQLAVVVNGTAGTTNPASLTYAQGLRAQTNSAISGGIGFASWTGLLNVNDVIWAQEDGTANFTNAESMMTITQVSN